MQPARRRDIDAAGFAEVAATAWSACSPRLVVGCRAYPDRTGIRQSLTLKAVRTTILDTIWPARTPTSAAAVATLAEAAGGGR